MQAPRGPGNLSEASCKSLTSAAGISGLVQPFGDGKQQSHLAGSGQSDAVNPSTCGHGSGPHKSGLGGGLGGAMDGVLSSVGTARRVVMGNAPAQAPASGGAAIGGIAGSVSTTFTQAITSAQAAVCCDKLCAGCKNVAQAALPRSCSGEAAKAANVAVNGTAPNGGANALNAGTAAPQRRRSRHGSRHSSRASSSITGSSAPSGRPRRGSSRRGSEPAHSDYASDASGASNNGGRARNGGGGRASRDHGLVDPREREQRRARRALRKYTSAFRFENGSDPKTDEEWHPMRRTRALVRDYNPQFPKVELKGPLKGEPPKKGALKLGAALGAAAAVKSEAAGVSTVAAPMKAIFALNLMGQKMPFEQAAAEAKEALKLGHKPTDFRARLRIILTKPRVEMGVLLGVVMYGMFVFFDLGIGMLAADWWRLTWSKIVDSAFLLLFVMELCLKLVAFGPTYLTSSPLNMIDAIAILLCAGLFILTDVVDVLNLKKLAPPVEDKDGGLEGQADTLTSGEEVGNDVKLAGLLLLLRMVRVIRLAVVMVRTINMSTRMGSSPQTVTNLSGLKESLENNLPGWRGTIIARQWEKIRRQESAKPDVDDVHLARETAGFLSDPANQDVVGLLTGNFQTLINVFVKLDKTRDGSLDRQEFIPGMISLGLSPETSESFFTALDVDGTGGVEVAELFRAGDFLKKGGAKKVAAERVSPTAVHIGNLPSIPGSSSSITKPHPLGLQPHARSARQLGIKEIGIFGVLKQRLPKLDLDRAKAKSAQALSWWTRERWDPTYELKATLRFLKPTRMADAKVRIRMAPPFMFKAGPVEIHTHFNGSGAMLETRIEQLMTLFEVTLADVGELSRKLQEIEVGQPKECAEKRQEIIIYRTYLEGLCQSIPAARLRVEPFRNDNPKLRSWQALAPNPTSEERVRVGSKFIGFYLFGVLCLRFLQLAILHTKWDGEESGHLRRKTCERLIAFNTTSAEIPTITLQLLKFQEDLSSKSLHEAGFCDSDDPYFVLYGASVLAPVLSMLLLPSFFVLFKQNINAIALQQTLLEPRVLLLMLQSILWAGISAINTTRYPVLLQIYEIPRVGHSLFLASLIDLFFFPCALGAFVLMDCMVVTAPRARCLLAFTLLFMLLERLGNYYTSDLPSSLERAGLAGSMISSLETSQLTQVLGGMAGLLGAPRAMIFIKLPTTLMELVLFEQGARELKKAQEADALRLFEEASAENRWLSKKGFSGSKSGGNTSDSSFMSKSGASSGAESSDTGF